MNQKFYFVDQSLENKNAINIFGSMILLVVLIGIPSFNFQILFFTCCFLFFLYSSFVLNKPLKFDIFIIFLILFLFLMLILSFINDNSKLTNPIILLESLLLIFIYSTFSVNSRTIFYVIFFSFLIFFFNFGWDKIFKYQHSISMVGMLFSLFYIVTGKKKYGILLLLLTIPIATRSVILGYFIGMNLWFFRNLLSDRGSKLIAIIIIIGLLTLSIFLGYFEFENFDLIEFSTMRSIFYRVSVEDLLLRGLSIFFPTGNDYSSSLLTNLEFYIDTDHRLYEYLKSFDHQCVHSIFLEWLINYGVFFMVFFILVLFKMANKKNIYFIAPFLIVIGFQCEALKPIVLVPFFIVYNLSNNFKVIQ